MWFIPKLNNGINKKSTKNKMIILGEQVNQESNFDLKSAQLLLTFSKLYFFAKSFLKNELRNSLK